jgi:hypothetical protein
VTLSTAPKRLFVVGVLVAAAPIVIGVVSSFAPSAKERDLGVGILLTGGFVLGWVGAVVIWLIGAVAAAVQIVRAPGERSRQMLWGAGNVLCALGAALFVYKIVYLP